MEKIDLIISGATIVVGAAGLPVTQNEVYSIMCSCLIGSGIGSFAGSFLNVTVTRDPQTQKSVNVRVRKRHVVNFLFGIALGPIITSFVVMQIPDYIPHFATGIAVSFLVGMLAVILICILGPFLLSRSKILWVIRLILKKKPGKLP